VDRQDADREPGVIRRLLVLGALAGGLFAASPGAALGANGDLWVYGTASTGDTGAAVLGGTAPAVAGLSTGGFEVAYQDANGALSTAGSNGSGGLGLSMAAGTSPAIAGMAGGAWEIAFQGSNSDLWTTGAAGVKPRHCRAL
jgi:hypothetical protein